MKQMRCWILPAFCLLALPVLGQNGMEVGSGVAKVGDNLSVPVSLNNSDEVQGLVAAIEWNGDVGTGVGLTLGAVLADADTVVSRVEDSYAVLGVVMDADGVGDEVIPAGSHEIASIEINVLVAGDTLTLNFADAAYNSVDGGPLLDNIVVVGGLSIGAGEDLGLGGGSYETVDCLPRFFIGGAPGNDRQATGSARVMLENCVDVEGFVVALCHDESLLTLASIDVGDAANAAGAEFASSEVSAAGGTLGVILDVEAPFDGQVISPGVNNIAIYNYRVASVGVDTNAALTFCDDTLGSPLKSNVFVSGGQSFAPGSENGNFVVTPLGDIPDPIEICDNGEDDDDDGLIDEADPDCQQAFACGDRDRGPIEASVGGSAEVCFFIQSPEDNAAGHAQFDHIQGFSMAVKYDCGLSASESLDISGTIVEAIGAEFVSVQADNDGSDGDGCELIIGVLVDALPPFDGATIPPLDDFQLVGCVDFTVADDEMLCGSEFEIAFCDGLNGTGSVPVKNLISVENQARTPAFENCTVTVVGQERFYRGDCNFSGEGMGMAVNIADAASTVSFLFLPGTWKFNPPCLDACDCNDDGRIDLADTMCILNYLFKSGRVPPAPGTGLSDGGGAQGGGSGPGPDPSDDKLDCAAGDDC